MKEKKNPFYLCSALIGLLYGVVVHRGEKKMQGVTKEEEEEEKMFNDRSSFLLLFLRLRRRRRK
jgi:hypothetical protein